MNAHSQKLIAVVIALSFSSIANATVDHTTGQIVGQLKDGSYSVLHDGGSTWNGVTRDEVTAQQVKSYQMAEALKSAQGNALAQAREAQAHAARYAAVSAKSSNATINQSAGSLPANTTVTATFNGKTVTTTAGALAQVNPQAQIQTPINSAFAETARKGGNSHNEKGNHSEHETGNGGNNAANSNSAHGLGGSNHVGGGSAESGSRNVGHW